MFQIWFKQKICNKKKKLLQQIPLHDMTIQGMCTQAPSHPLIASQTNVALNQRDAHGPHHLE